MLDQSEFDKLWAAKVGDEVSIGDKVYRIVRHVAEITHADYRRFHNRIYKAAHPETVKAGKARYKAAHPEAKRRETERNYHRPFIAIDAEGMDYPGENEEVRHIDDHGIERIDIYPKHRTFLWGAKGWSREVRRRLTETDIANGTGLRGAETHADWLGVDKTPLSSREILDWLLTLPAKFKEYGGASGVNFIMFSFGYDMTQLLSGLPYKTVWEIYKRESFKKDADGKRRALTAPVLYGPFSINFMKGKSITIGRLRDSERPFKQGADGKRSARPCRDDYNL